MTIDHAGRRDISDATVNRLPVYLRALEGCTTLREDIIRELALARPRSAPTVLTVPDDVQVRGVDMASELQILAFREQQSRSGAWVDEMKELIG